MSTTAVPPATAAPPRRHVLAWASWDWGQAAYQAVITTFVFTVYVTTAVAPDPTPPGRLSGETQLGVALGLAGVAVALLAPVLGQRADATARRKRSIAVWTGLVVLSTAAMVFVRRDPAYLLLGLGLLAVSNVFNELAGVSYNAMLKQVSTPQTVGRVSGFGWAAGYLGGIVLLPLVLVLFIRPNLSGLSSADGLNIRMVALVSAAWFAVFALPLLLVVPEPAPAASAPPRTGFWRSYRVLWRTLTALFRTDRNAVKFLVAQAIYRDGLAAIFSFGAVLATAVYGLSAGDVIVFGIAANVVAAAGALVAGLVEDRVGPRVVILTSLAALLVSAGVLLFAHGPVLFWIFGLALCLWVGPAQASSRSFLTRLAPAGHEGQMFGLYTTTGRAASFFAPALFALFSGLFHAARAGIVGIVIVLAVGGIALLFVRPPRPGDPSALP